MDHLLSSFIYLNTPSPLTLNSNVFCYFEENDLGEKQPELKENLKISTEFLGFLLIGVVRLYACRGVWEGTHVSSQDPISGPHIYATSTLTTESAPQPLNTFPVSRSF